MDKEEPEKVLMILHPSRKAYLIEYTCGVVLLIVLLFLSIQGIFLRPMVRNVVIGLAFFAIIVPECFRFLICYKITNHKISITKGFLKHSKKNVGYLPLAFVPDISMKQTRIQRILDYGTVFVEGQGGSAQKPSF